MSLKPGQLLRVIYYRTEDTNNYPAKEWLNTIDVDAKFKLKLRKESKLKERRSNSNVR